MQFTHHCNRNNNSLEFGERLNQRMNEREKKGSGLKHTHTHAEEDRDSEYNALTRDDSTKAVILMTTIIIMRQTCYLSHFCPFVLGAEQKEKAFVSPLLVC